MSSFITIYTVHPNNSFLVSFCIKFPPFLAPVRDEVLPVPDAERPSGSCAVGGQWLFQRGSLVLPGETQPRWERFQVILYYYEGREVCIALKCSVRVDRLQVEEGYKTITTVPAWALNRLNFFNHGPASRSPKKECYKKLRLYIYFHL